MSMKIEVLVKITDADGNESFEPVTVTGDLPDFSEFTGPDNFREIFDKSEIGILKINTHSMKSGNFSLYHLVWQSRAHQTDTPHS